MAFSNPKVYIDELAKPMCDRFINEPNSYELAISCSIILYHFADVVAYVKNKKPHEIADLITAKIPKFGIIRAIANAAKHVELTRHPVSTLVGLRAEHLVRGKAAAFSDGTYFSDGTSFRDMPEVVVVETPDRVKHDVLHTCQAVLEDLLEQQDLFQV
ncbi:hypothetical protein [Profundibacter sp.]